MWVWCGRSKSLFRGHTNRVEFNAIYISSSSLLNLGTFFYIIIRFKFWGPTNYEREPQKKAI